MLYPKSSENIVHHISRKMLWRFSLAVVSLMTIAGCSMANQLESKNNAPNYKLENENNLPNYKLVRQKNIAVYRNDSFEIAQNIPEKTELTDSENISLSSPENILERQTILKLIPTERTNAVGNPIYRLDLYENGRLIKSYDTVTGRHDTQQRDRHVSGTEAPLPDGEYSVANYFVRGTHQEVGGRFIPITPRFSTGRSALGIHFDPSYEKDDGEDGTAGCIAFTNREDLDDFLEYLALHNFQSLIVEINSISDGINVGTN